MSLGSPAAILYDSNGNPVTVVQDGSDYRVLIQNKIEDGTGTGKLTTVIDDVTTPTNKRLLVEADIKPGAVIQTTTGTQSVDSVVISALNGGSPDMVVDGSSTPVFLDDDWITISVGGVETLFFDYTISSGSSSGGYNVNVMLWTDWLKSGKALSAKIGEANFNVN